MAFIVFLPKHCAFTVSSSGQYMTSNIVITDVCYCGHKRNCHFMGGPCYFPDVLDNVRISIPNTTTNHTNPFNKPFDKCQCREFRINPESLVQRDVMNTRELWWLRYQEDSEINPVHQLTRITTLCYTAILLLIQNIL